MYSQCPVSVIPVILSGGTGSRLWPVSREAYPKQFWALVTERSLLQETVLRGKEEAVASSLLHFAPLLVVCNHEHRFKIAEQLREVGVADAQILLEPEGRNSAPAIAAAALVAAEKDPEAVLWVMPADSAIMEPENVGPVLERAVVAAQADHITVFGMEPTRAETGYGYIEKGEALASLPDVFKVSSFIEKPDTARAEIMCKSSKHLWNSGMFIFKAHTMLEEIERYQPELLAVVRQAVAGRKVDLDFERLDEEAFRRAPDISIDYAIAEHSQKIAVVPASFGWSDVGSWEVLWEIGVKDSQGNVTSGDILLSETRESYVRSDGILTVVSGLDHAVVVATKDAVLVTHRDKTQEVKHIVSRLKEEKRSEAVAHNFTYRPWGAYENLIQGNRFRVKRIVVMPGQKLSLQKHYHRAEHWVVVEGTAMVTRNDEQVMVRENESIYLPLGCVHRLENQGKIPLTLIEVQSGPYLGEDDIIRFDDVYSRP